MKGRCNDMQCNDVQCDDMQCNDVQCNDVQCNDVQHNEVQHNDVQHNDIQCMASILAIFLIVLFLWIANYGSQSTEGNFFCRTADLC